ncbi:diguanylate cyclase (GGDEF) domain-containing protein [Bradyrhizobium lablabi]|uniref:Diguanylate cyclase (GGDEF) domain-containing protein n=1 Tax=Bradyrhizobium lablabi TaxID=722472 RepID=A0A1M6NY80_9BRAD|nr:PAS-domain containing protein [Bradyrhizobium lablabi]SHK00699.1 diguanylate cyclase (GGDEF) domain-containing protein [Bradyrhizobium lablabi]
MHGIYQKLARSPVSSLTALGVLLSVATVALFLVDLQSRYDDRIATAKTDAQSFATVLAEHTALTFEDVDRVLLEAAAIGKRYTEPGTANAALRQLQKSSSVIVAIGWTDASGQLIAHSYDHAPPRINISGMSHFIAQRDATDDRLFIAAPYRSAAGDKWFTAASRRLTNADGSFAGVVTAPIDQSYFLKIFRAIDLGKRGSVTLLHREGRVLARRPERTDAFEKSFMDVPFFTKYLPTSDAGALESTSPIDGESRIAGYKAVARLPLVLIVSYARGDVLAPWYHHLYTFGPLVAAIVVIIMFGTFVLVRQTNALAANTAALASTNARFDAALSNMPDGLSMFDADEKLLVSNSRYREMYDLTEEQVGPGTPLSRIVSDYKTAGTGFDPDIFAAGAKARAPHTLTLADGRVILIQRTPMKDGGWVATHRDITEKRRAEARLVSANDRLDAAIGNMSQGLCLFDAEKRLVVSNRRFQEMYRLPDELVLPGTPLARILQHYADRGEQSDLTVDQHVELMPTQLKQNYVPADGREILIQRKPLPDGGWVATHEDVTEQKRAEQLLAEKAAELEAMNIRFDAALNNMSQGLCMFDAEQKVVVSNARYGDIYNLGRGQIKPGTSLRQILEFRRQAGTSFATAPEVYLKVNVKEASEIQELADGRVVAIARHTMPGGGWLTTHEDITDRARNERRIAFLAQHDLLTGLANRALFSEKLDDAAKRLARHGITFTVLALDLDKFKNVNDTLGHPAGDQLLIEVARRLNSSLRDTDVLARFGGDEFAIIQENEKNQSEGAIKLALRIIGLIQQPFDLNGHRVSIGTSIGIAFAPEHGADAETLLKRADLALYAAKSGGRNDFRIFEPELTEAADIQKSMEGELREAIAQSELELHYQPVIDVRTRAVCGVEAFVRWHHPSRGLLAADQFLPLAEQTGLMLPLGEWILQQACVDAAAWPPHIRVAINISAAQFNKGNLFDVVLCALVESGLAPERLELEIAEASLLDKNQAAHLQTIRQLKSLGVSMVLDNCGTGYSSASYLTGFPFDKIKIDRSVAQGFASRRDCAAVVASVLALAHGLDIATAAKGVESREQFEALQAAGVDFAQGYLFGHPVPHAELDLDAVIPMAKNVA